MRRPDYFDLIRNRAWKDDAVFPVGPTMLIEDEILLLRWIAKNCQIGRGSVLDCGCFLGGSTISLAQGLKEGPAPTKKLHSFDLFVAGEVEARHNAKDGVEAGKSFRPLFEKNVSEFRDLIEIHEGDITQATVPEGEIDLLFIDCAKLPAINDFFVGKLFPRLVPGSIVIQQDYLHEFLPWVKITMEYFSDYFELLYAAKFNSVVYGCIKQIPPKVAIGGLWTIMGRNIKHLMMQQAINRWEGEQRQFVIRSYGSYSIDEDKWV